MGCGVHVGYFSWVFFVFVYDCDAVIGTLYIWK